MTVAIISHPDCLRHDMGRSHPEQPARLRVIADALSDADFSSELKNVEAPAVTREQLARAHSERYIDSIYAASPEHGLVRLDPDTWMNPFTLAAAERAAGAAVLGVDLVMAGEVSDAFCNVRPPGHHAERAQAMGFCFFNNVAIATLHALEHHHLQRVAIVDFDVHHGNGTEDIFKNDDRVLLCSSFQHPFYPFQGANKGRGNMLPIPLSAGANGKIFREAVEQQWLAKLTEFKPDMIFFSAGFDGHEKDQLANIALHEEDYAWITRKVKAIANAVCGGRVVSTLEGGYALDALARSAVAHVGAVLP
jgi:acetoin utilization deacetylase AcuC-like enzyme